MSADKKFTLAELKEKSGKDNLHLLINGKVYAIAKFMDEHPGGDEVLIGEAGRDATEAFEDVGHSDEAREIMEQYLVGECDEAPRKEPTPAPPSTGTQQSQGSSNFGYLLPLGILIAYLAYHFYSEKQKTAA